MPIYRYKCPTCGETEIRHPMHQLDKEHLCACGQIMKRLPSISNFRMARKGKDIVTETLNSEYKKLPPEQVAIMAPGLKEPDRPKIGRGF